MIVQKVNYDLSHVKWPTLDEAKTMCSKYLKPVNGHVLVLSVLPPSKTAGGTIISSDVKKNIQAQLQKKGTKLVKYCNSLEDNIQVKDLFEGCYVVIGIHGAQDIKDGEIVEDENGLKFEALVVPSHCVITIVEEPNYD